MHIISSMLMMVVREYSVYDIGSVLLGSRKRRSNVMPSVIPIGAVARMSIRFSKNTIFVK